MECVSIDIVVFATEMFSLGELAQLFDVFAAAVVGPGIELRGVLELQAPPSVNDQVRA
jgi:hypothetical protein